MKLKKIFSLLEADIHDKEITNPETGNKIKISTALSYPEDHPAHINAKKLVANYEKKKSSPKIGINKAIMEKYKKFGLKSFPPANVDINTVQENKDKGGNIVLQWTDPNTGRTVKSYTKKYLAENAKIKWARVKKMKPETIQKISDRSNKLLNSKDISEQETGAIISIIAQTGLRPGSKVGYEDTGNRGVSTLGPKNVFIDGDTIKLNFIGKSTKENNAVIKDAKLAAFLNKKLETHKDKDFLFDLNDSQLDSIYAKKINPGKVKIKDLRTYTATKMAGEVLNNNNLPPLPIPENPKELKKQVKIKLSDCYEQVSQRLNNTPAMAKSSYIHPEIIKNWFKTIGVEPSIADSVNKNNQMKLSSMLKEIEDENELSQIEANMNPADLEDCDQYNLPEWWDNESIDLIPVKKLPEPKLENISEDINKFDIEYTLRNQLNGFKKIEKFDKKGMQIRLGYRNTSGVEHMMQTLHQIYNDKTFVILRDEPIMSGGHRYIIGIK